MRQDNIGPVTPRDRVEAGIRNDVLPGLVVGELLPTLRVLAETYGVSPATAHQAMKRLEDVGLVASRQGYGTCKVRDDEPEAVGNGVPASQADPRA